MRDPEEPPMHPDEPQQLVMLVDPTWSATPESPEPTIGMIVGGWFVQPDGTTGPFEPNPAYEPSHPDSPTDPVDAVLQLLARQESSAEALVSVLKDVRLAVALGDDAAAIVTPAPDEVPCVLVATAPPHRARVDAASWREVSLAELAAALPDSGIDVLLNPGGPASMRLLADVVRDAADET
jgi:hypothetical protein